MWQRRGAIAEVAGILVAHIDLHIREVVATTLATFGRLNGEQGVLLAQADKVGGTCLDGVVHSPL